MNLTVVRGVSNTFFQLAEAAEAGHKFITTVERRIDAIEDEGPPDADLDEQARAAAFAAKALPIVKHELAIVMANVSFRQSLRYALTEFYAGSLRLSVPDVGLEESYTVAKREVDKLLYLNNLFAIGDAVCANLHEIIALTDQFDRNRSASSEAAAALKQKREAESKMADGEDTEAYFARMDKLREEQRQADSEVSPFGQWREIMDLVESVLHIIAFHPTSASKAA